MKKLAALVASIFYGKVTGYILIGVIGLAIACLTFTTTTAFLNRDPRSIPAKIMDTIVAVDSASGVVIFSDGQRTLVLTAYHVISDSVTAYAKCKDVLLPNEEDKCVWSIEVETSVAKVEHQSHEHTAYHVVNVEMDSTL